MSWRRLWIVFLFLAGLVAAPATANAAEPSAPVEESSDGGVPKVVPALITAAGGVALISGMVTASLTLVARTKMEWADTLGERRDAAETGRALATTTDALLVGGALLTFIGVVWLTKPNEPAGDDLALTPLLSGDTLGMGLSWRFE